MFIVISKALMTQIKAPRRGTERKMSQTVAITGNTYPVKEQLKSLGARWNGEQKAWMVAQEKADEARKIVAGAPAKAKAAPITSQRRSSCCADCGTPTKGFYRCRDCNMERREGGSRYMGGMSYRDRNGNFVLGDDD